MKIESISNLTCQPIHLIAAWSAYFGQSCVHCSALPGKIALGSATISHNTNSCRDQEGTKTSQFPR